MTALQRQQFQARVRTLQRIGVEVWSPDGISLALRPQVLCSRSLHGDGKRHGWDGSVRTQS